MRSFQCLKIDEALHLTPITTEGAVESCQREVARVWIDLQDFERAELEAWLDRLGFAGLPRQLCLEARTVPATIPEA